MNGDDPRVIPGSGVPEVEQEALDSANCLAYRQRHTGHWWKSGIGISYWCDGSEPKGVSGGAAAKQEPHASAIIGYTVLINEHGRWTNGWDGEIHETRKRAAVELPAARHGNPEAFVAALVRVDTAEEQPGGAAALRADVVTAVLEEVEALRREAGAYGDACDEYGQFSSTSARGLALRRVEAAWAVVTARLALIAAAVKGEQR